MKFPITLSKPQLRVLSAIFANLVAGWFAAIFVTKDLIALTGNIVGAIVSLYIAVKIEELLEE